MRNNQNHISELITENPGWTALFICILVLLFYVYYLFYSWFGFWGMLICIIISIFGVSTQKESIYIFKDGKYKEYIEK